MEVHTTARRVKVTPAVQRHLDERLAKLTRYVPELREAHVKLTAEKYRHRAEILIRVRREDLVGSEEAADLVSAVEGAVLHLEKQLRKIKEKKSRKVVSRRLANGEVRRAAAVAALGTGTRASRRSEPADFEEEELEEPGPRRPRVVRASSPDGKPLTLDEAVDRVVADGLPFLVFIESKSERPCVLYRRPDGDLALIEARR
jgi:putative sigma-54 modulation protein